MSRAGISTNVFKCVDKNKERTFYSRTSVLSSEKLTTTSTYYMRCFVIACMKKKSKTWSMKKHKKLNFLTLNFHFSSRLLLPFSHSDYVIQPIVACNAGPQEWERRRNETSGEEVVAGLFVVDNNKYSWHYSTRTRTASEENKRKSTGDTSQVIYGDLDASNNAN